MPLGKLYRLSDNQFLATVNYQFHNETAISWWGELTLNDNINIRDTEGCVIELEDKRRGKCFLKKMVNRAVSGVPSRYVYRFTGTGFLE